MKVFTRSASARAAVGLAAVSAILLSGCAAAAEPEAAQEGFEGQTLTVWFPGTNQVEIDLVTGPLKDKFEAETGATLDVTFVDWGDLSTKLNAGFAAGTAPDVFGHGPAAVADFAINGRLEPLDDYVAGLEQADIDDLSAALPGGTVGGVQYLMPLSMQGNLIVYDAADFEEAGLDPDAPPTTWEEVREAAEALTIRDASGTITRSGLLLPSQPIGRQQTFAALIASAGGSQLTDDDLESAFASPEGEKALEFYAGLYAGDDAVSYPLGADYINAPAAQQPLVLDTASMTMQTPNGANQIIAAAPELDLRIMDAVPFEGVDEGYTLGGSGPGLILNADSEVKDLGWAFIEYMISPEISAEYVQGIGGVPTRASAADTDYVQNSPVLQAFVANSSNFLPNPNVPGWVQVRDALDKYLEQALNGVTSAADALAAASPEIDSILESAR